MGPQVVEVVEDRDLPERVDVVVIGGGIIGVSTALFLAEKGISVAVCEKGPIAGEQSSRNWGWCRATHRDLRELELSLESLKLWRELDRTLGIDRIVTCASSNSVSKASSCGASWTGRSALIRAFGNAASSTPPMTSRPSPITKAGWRAPSAWWAAKVSTHALRRATRRPC